MLHGLGDSRLLQLQQTALANADRFTFCTPEVKSPSLIQVRPRRGCSVVDAGKERRGHASLQAAALPSPSSKRTTVPTRGLKQLQA